MAEQNNKNKWDKEKVLRELRLRSGEHRSIRFSDGPEDDALKDAVFEFFGGWKSALAAAGLHPKTKLLNCWTENEVKRRIKEIADRGESINTLSLEINHPRLWNAARRVFGNIQAAVEASGYDYSDFKKRGAWTKDLIAERIRQYYKEGKDLSQISMLEEDSKLLAAAQKIYGAWSRAVHAAGIDYTQVKARRKEFKRQMKAGDFAQKKKVFVLRDGKLVPHEIRPPGE